jgi:hypothetical protein
MEDIRTSQNNPQDQTNIRVSIRTLDHKVHNVSVSANATVFELKIRIKDLLDIEIEDINLLYKGSSLAENHTLSFYNIRNESIVNMLATSRTFRTSSQPSERSVLRANQQANDSDIVNNILKTLTETAVNRRNQKLKSLQSRSKGFSVLEKESLEVIRQNLLSSEQIMASREDQSQLAIKTTGFYPFNFGKRKFELGQWLDVKDTIDQWLEAEVIEIRESEIKIHYNGWGVRWDEWIDVSSQRVAFFRNKTVQPYTTFYLSPVPQSRLSGDVEFLEPPINEPNTIFKRTCSALQEASNSLKVFIDLSAQKDATEAIKLASTSHQPNSNKKNPVSKYNRDIKGMKDNKSHLSLKFNDKELSVRHNIDDSKSVRLPNNSQLENELLQKKDSIIGNSPRSTKSIKSQISSHGVFYNYEHIYEGQREIIEEDLHREISSEFEDNDDQVSFQTDKGSEFSIPKKNTSQSREEPALDQILALKAAQLAPILDRIGRALIDLAPHIASLGQEEFQTENDESSQTPLIPQVLGIFNRYMYEGSRNSNQNAIITNNLAFKKHVNYQVPVMLTPGEIINTVNPSPPIFSDNFIDLNLHAVVRNEQRTPSVLFQEKGIQTSLPN